MAIFKSYVNRSNRNIIVHPQNFDVPVAPNPRAPPCTPTQTSPQLYLAPLLPDLPGAAPQRGLLGHWRFCAEDAEALGVHVHLGSSTNISNFFLEIAIFMMVNSR